MRLARARQVVHPVPGPKRPAVAALAAAVLLGLAAAAPCAGFSLQYRLTERFEVRKGPHTRLLVADMNGDGSDDLLFADSARVLCDHFAAGARRPLFDVELAPRGELQAGVDAVGDGRRELLFTSYDGSAFWLHCLDLGSDGRKESPRWTAGPYLKGCRMFAKEGRTGLVGFLGCLDGDGDGRPEVYIYTYPFAPGVEPRRLVCLDGATGRSRWSLDVASPVEALQLWTGPRRSERELVIGTYATDNGFRCGSEDDAHCYLEGVSPSGKREWSVRLGGVFCAAIPHLVSATGGRPARLLACVSIGAAAGDSVRRAAPDLLEVDPRLGTVLGAIHTPVPVNDFAVGDLDGDGRPEIVAHGQDQALYCYGEDLALRWVFRERAIEMRPEMLDMLGDHRQELVCANPHSLIVVDATGHLIAQSNHEALSYGAAAMRLAGRTRLLSIRETDARVLGLDPPTVPAAVVELGGGGLATAMAATLYARRRRRRAEQLVDLDEAQDRLLDAMVAFGHGGASLAIVDRLRFHLRNWARLCASGPAQALAPVLNDYESYALPDLVRLVSLARRAEVRPQHWRQLAAQALSITELLQPLLKSGPDREDLRLRAESALDHVDGCLRGMREHLRQVWRAPVGNTLRRVLERRAPALEEAGIEVETDLCSPEDLAVFAAPHELEKILDGLVENAARAMAGSAVRRLRVATEVEGAHCRIEVADTGCGVSAEDPERIFDRDYTTRAGGGFGLYYARQVLARYDGKIHVACSDPRRGTTLRAVLRIA